MAGVAGFLDLTKFGTTAITGHETDMLKCGECHNYMLPDKIDVDEWEDAMPKMIRHAGLAEDDEKAVLSYVLAVKAM